MCANVVKVNTQIPDAPNRVWLNDGTGQFTLLSEFGPIDRTWSVTAGDVDGDGDIDVVTGERSGLRVWLNDGTGALTLKQVLDFAEFTFGLALGDMDGDGDLDLVTPRRLYLNDGTGGMTMLAAFQPSPRERYDLALGDLDGDGDLDVAIGMVRSADSLGIEPNVVHYGSGTR